MMLHKNEVLTKNTTLKDDQGQSSLALEVFAHSIRFLKKDLLEVLDREIVEPKIYEYDIQWVLTIPAIWNPQSKEFMRAAAEEAGIQRQQLEFALEPEAASVYVKEIIVSTTGDDKELVPFESGTKYMVLDLGGGTIDIVVKEVREDRTLRELHHAFGNGLGGESVNTRFLKYFSQVLGSDFMDELKTNNEYKSSWLDFETEIEQKKRELDLDDEGRLKLNISGPFLELFEKMKGTSLKEHCSSITHMSCKRDKLYIHKDAIKQLFQPSVESIVKFLEDIMDKDYLFDISDVILVGGFSQCQMISDAVKNACRGLKVVVPDDADLAVLKGAVIYRHWPEVIYSRRAVFSLGARFLRAWLDGDDIEKQFKNARGERMCKDFFSKFVTKNQEFATSDKATLVVYPLEKDTKVVPVMLFKSEEESPRYTTDPSCTAFGKSFNVEMSDLKGGLNREVHVTLTMGSTEIRVKGQQIPDGAVKEIQLDLLKD